MLDISGVPHRRVTGANTAIVRAGVESSPHTNPPILDSKFHELKKLGCKGHVACGYMGGYCTPKLCCLKYIKKPLPQRILKSFERTHSLCKIPAI
ncbi:hypothetical protein L345_03973, partial [Ophiophagus hannah]